MKYNKNFENHDDELMEAKSRLQNASSYWSTQYINIEDDRRMATGYQWDGKDKQHRDLDNLPASTIGIIQPTIDKIVNEIRTNPFGIKLNIKEPQIRKLYQGLVRSIEYDSNAAEAYEIAFESAVTTGMGFISVVTDYSDPESLNQVIKVKPIRDTTTVYIDPTSESICGADMEYAFQLDYIDKHTAAREYNLDADKIAKQPIFTEMFKDIIVPQDAVPVVLYMYKSRKNITRTWLLDGSHTDDAKSVPEEMVAGKRKISTTTVKVCKYVGTEKVTETELKTQFIPIIPVYGDKVFGNASRNSIQSNPNWSGYAGITKRMWDSQDLLNLSASREKLLIGLSPISPVTAPAEAIKGYEDLYRDMNTRPVSNLPYNHVDEYGNPIAAPTRLDNTAQTGFLEQAQATAINLAQRSSGIMDSQLGKEDIAGQSGIAMMTKQNTGNMVIAHYTANLVKSIIQAGKIVVELIDSIYDTGRELTLRDEKGASTNQFVNMSTVPIKPTDVDITVEAGPIFANERKEAVANLLSLGQIIPDKFSMFADILVRNLDTPGSTEVAERLESMLPPELKPESDEVEAPDPQAMMALQSAEQTIGAMNETIEKYEAIIKNLQTQIIDSIHDREAKITEAKIDADVTLTKAELDNATKVRVAEIQSESKALSDNKKLVNERLDRIANVAETGMETNVEISQVADLSPDAAMTMTEKTAGPISGELEGADIGEDIVEDISNLLEDDNVEEINLDN